MNLKQIIPLIYFGVAIFIFEMMNWYGTKYVQESWIQIGKYALMTLPLQMIGYIFLVRGLNTGFKEFTDIWSFIVTTTTITWIIKMFTAYGFFRTLPKVGKIIALILLIIANFIDKLWK